MANDALAKGWVKVLGGDRKQFDMFFDKMMDGFAYHRIVVDKAGKPVDYVFLEVNHAFEKMTGLKRERIIGKKVTDVLPGIEKDPADWIGVYGKVALTGEPVQFENHAAPLGKWHSVSAYCPEKGYFVALFEDITERKKCEEQVARIASFPFLNPNPILEADFDGNITYCNPAAKTNFANLEALGSAHPLLSDWQNVVKSFEGKLSGTFNREVKIDEQWYLQQLYLVPNNQRIRIYTVNSFQNARKLKKLYANYIVIREP